MKTAYELAMERLNKNSPAIKMSPAQKKQLAELDSRYAAKIAEREIALQDEIQKAAQSGEPKKIETLQHQLQKDRQSLQAELESKKEKVRQEQG